MKNLNQVIAGIDYLVWEKGVEDTKEILTDAVHYLKQYQTEKYIWDEIRRYHPEIKELLEKYHANIG